MARIRPRVCRTAHTLRCLDSGPWSAGGLRAQGWSRTRSRLPSSSPPHPRASSLSAGCRHLRPRKHAAPPRSGENSLLSTSERKGLGFTVLGRWTAGNQSACLGGRHSNPSHGGLARGPSPACVCFCEHSSIETHVFAHCVRLQAQEGEQRLVAHRAQDLYCAASWGKFAAPGSCCLSVSSRRASEGTPPTCESVACCVAGRGKEQRCRTRLLLFTRHSAHGAWRLSGPARWALPERARCGEREESHIT